MPTANRASGTSRCASSSRCRAARFGSPVSGSWRASWRSRSTQLAVAERDGRLVGDGLQHAHVDGLEASRVAQPVVDGEQADRTALAEHRHHDAVTQAVPLEPGALLGVAAVAGHEHGLPRADDGVERPRRVPQVVRPAPAQLVLPVEDDLDAVVPVEPVPVLPGDTPEVNSGPLGVQDLAGLD